MDLPSHQSPTSRELLNEDSRGINPGARELALLRRQELIARQFTSGARASGSKFAAELILLSLAKPFRLRGRIDSAILRNDEPLIPRLHSGRRCSR